MASHGGESGKDAVRNVSHELRQSHLEIVLNTRKYIGEVAAGYIDEFVHALTRID